MGWLLAAGACTVLAELSWAARLWIIVLVGAVTGRILWGYVLLRGPRAVRALEWAAERDLYHVFVGPLNRRLQAVPLDCRRYGRYLWLLRFRTAEGLVELLVDPACQEPRALRSAARRLLALRVPGTRAVRAVRGRQADTIPRKV